MRQLAASALPEAAERRFVAKLREEIQSTVNGQYIESNERTAALTGIDLALLGYQQSGPTPRRVHGFI